MRDSTKMLIAGGFLILAIVVWIGSGTAMFYYYYEKVSFEANREVPTKQQFEQLQVRAWELADNLAALKDTKNAPNHLDIDKNMPSFAEALDKKIAELSNELENENRDIETYKQNAEESIRPFDEALSGFGDTRRDYREKVAQARERLMTERESMSSEREAEKDRITTFDNEIRELVNRVAAMEDEQRNERVKLLSELQKYEKLLSQIMARKQEQESGVEEFDGEILLVNLRDNFVILDVGRRDRVRKGMKFEIYGVIKGVLPIYKGAVEIREVGVNISYARILEMTNVENPLQKGDKIANKLYRRGEQLVFVLVGRLKNFNREEFSRFVTDMGDVVKSQVDTETDYLIVGAGVENNPAAQDQINLARELGVRIITENVFLNLVTY